MTTSSPRGIFIIALSFLLALLLSILPLPQWLDLLAPQWVALVVIYWVIALPHRINLGIAWLVGIMLDGLYGSLLGEHALALLIVAFITDRLHQQIRMFPILQQAVCVFFLILVYQVLLIWIQGMLGLLTNVYLFWISALTSMLMWPWLFIVLRASRRRFQIY